MPEPSGLATATMTARRSPVSISTESSRRSSFRPAHLSARNSALPRALSPPVRLTRKRAATLSSERANLSQGLGDLAIAAASITAPQPDLIREQVCLCQPDPKIPRPRNAFILYRQHYQAQVIAQNPGLANPEISKIIGERWRDQAPEVKNEWKRLAEEEKQRHRRQYPGYRYQPRRAGRTASARQAADSSFADNPGRCPKCSGRYISTPSTPLTPISHSSESSISPRKEQHTRVRLALDPRNPVSQQPNGMAQMQINGMSSPQASTFRQNSPRQTPYARSQPLALYQEKDDDIELLPSPPVDNKRRRYNPEAQYTRGYPSPSAVSFSPSQPYSRSGLATSGDGYRSQAPPGYARQSTTVQTPQIQPTSTTQAARQGYTNHSSSFTESLHLPPLQTQLPNAQISRHKHDLSTTSSTQHSDPEKNIEATIMTIPYINKIKVLSKISPPLAAPSHVHPIRGAVIAVEGPDHTIVAEVGEIIHDHLMRDSSCGVKTWSVPEVPRADGEDVEMRGMSGSRSGSGSGSVEEIIDPLVTSPEANGDANVVRKTSKTGDAFLEYLSIISAWHKLSPEIVQYITMLSSPSPAFPSTTLAHPLSSSSSSTSTSSTATSNSSSSTPTTLTPIALLPRGFSLSTSDTHARRIPLTDAYAPVDHWQWMATLWRGIVGPDLTVYVRRVDASEWERFGAVEVRTDCAAIVVRVLGGRGTDGSEVGNGIGNRIGNGMVEEKTSRRLGFEVVEFVRGVEGRGVL